MIAPAFLPASPQSVPESDPLALTPAQNEALIREVDDAVRQDDLLHFWQRWGKAVIVLVVLGLMAFGGWLLWQNHRHSQADQAGEQLSVLLKAAQGAPLDAQLLDTLRKSGFGGQTAAANTLKAGLTSGAGDTKTAIAEFDAIIADKSAPQAYRDLALLRRTILTFDATPPAKVIEALAPLAQPGKPFFGSAAEVTAAAQLKLNQTKAAANTYAEITRDKTAPVNIRVRAAQMASALGVDSDRIGTIETMEKPVAAQ